MRTVVAFKPLVRWRVHQPRIRVPATEKERGVAFFSIEQKRLKQDNFRPRLTLASKTRYRFKGHLFWVGRVMSTLHALSFKNIQKILVFPILNTIFFLRCLILILCIMWWYQITLHTYCVKKGTIWKAVSASLLALKYLYLKGFSSKRQFTSSNG